jgi:arylsulfatase A-like enzyme
LSSTALVAKRPNNIIAMAGDMGWSDIGYYGGRTGEELKAEGK